MIEHFTVERLTEVVAIAREYLAPTLPYREEFLWYCPALILEIVNHRYLEEPLEEGVRKVLGEYSFIPLLEYARDGELDINLFQAYYEDNYDPDTFYL